MHFSNTYLPKASRFRTWMRKQGPVARPLYRRFLLHQLGRHRRMEVGVSRLVDVKPAELRELGADGLHRHEELEARKLSVPAREEIDVARALDRLAAGDEVALSALPLGIALQALKALARRAVEAGARLYEGVTVTGMDLDSLQGDRAVCRVLAAMGGQVRTAADRVTVRPGPRVPTRMDARDIPDLVPVLAAVAAATPGVTEITGAARLRLKESDRLETTARMLSGLGGQVEETADGLLIRGRSHLSGGQVDAAGDHRIAMAAAVASGACTGPVTITGAQAVEKSYPTFWAELRSLGKQVEETPVGP